MNEIVRSLIENNYEIGQPFFTHDIYNHLGNMGYSRSQISSSLNQLKKQGIITNEINNGLNNLYNREKGKRLPKVWMRVK
jgi:DNA-binding transcriptional regulator GbsR (MarR family)